MADLPLVVLTNRTFPETRAMFEGRAHVVANDGIEPWPRARLLEEVRKASGLMAFMTEQIDAEFLEACPELRIIGAALKGYDNIDVEAARQRGVMVTIVPDLLTEPTAELAIGLAIALGRRVLEGDALVRGGDFAGWRPRLYGRGLHGSTVGILGFGKVGQVIARQLEGFGCRILASDLSPVAAVATSVEFATPEHLLEVSDFVFLALPLADATVGMIGASELARMKPGAFLINPARGSLVDESAVADALEAGRLGGYAADVFAFEDWARDDRPLRIDQRLSQPGARTVLTPHIGSATVSARRMIEAAAARSIVQGLAGEIPDGLVTPLEQLGKTC
ncbi:NAD(P)-dependent oxidoreductase [Rhabdaerophilum sp. SD176]|uniref:NAD(P)-dependent oxidoreductase n=1 Tax=Rhabdaerophilum sp. SD176 TaxID=2983548 RepID=UPI0024DF3819|nr:NAD(P)-dependent oxidoreductase [Rhabdaerophilum sp. SD176]